MRFILAMVVALAPVGLSAHEVDDVPSRVQLIEELRGMNASLRQAQARLDTSLAVDAAEVVKVLNDAQVAFLAEDHPRAALQLMGLVARPAFKEHLAYPEALEYLAESLEALGLHASARTYLRQAVDHPRQLPTVWRRRLARLLELSGRSLTLPELRALWGRFRRELDEDEGLAQADTAVFYQYAKALVSHDVLDEAADLFAQVPEGDPGTSRPSTRGHHPAQAWPAREGPGRLRGGAGRVGAQPAGAARAALARRRGRRRRRPRGGDHPPDGGRAAAAPEVARHARIGAAIHLSLARLAAARNDDARAWNHYRRVPRGDPEFAAALAEATFILFRREEYTWCARLVDQLLAGRGDDLSAAQLQLWKGQLLARGRSTTRPWTPTSCWRPRWPNGRRWWRPAPRTSGASSPSRCWRGRSPTTRPGRGGWRRIWWRRRRPSPRPRRSPSCWRGWWAATRSSPRWPVAGRCWRIWRPA
ncbi:MAG: hypothetical protein R3F43_23165 [bacterium]